MDRPILFSAPMVRALLAGTKTQTRRVLKPQPNRAECVIKPGADGRRVFAARDPHDMEQGLLMLGEVPSCPYGRPSDRLWVRETWAYHLHAQSSLADDDGPWVYAADGEQALQRRLGPRWRPSIHMPRYVSRITLEVTEVRAERLQDISESDADAEGCERLDSDREDPDWNLCPQCGGTRLYISFGPNLGACPDTDCTKCDTYVKRYRHLWESINGAGSWDANPWVWAVAFKVVKP